MIAIIDYDAGNIKSVEKALNYLGEEAIITRDHDEIVNSFRELEHLQMRWRRSAIMD